MIWLVLSIICSSSLVLILKAFRKNKVNTFNGIVVNYFTCTLCGILASYHTNTLNISDGFYDWWPYSILLGSVFIGVFFIIAQTAQVQGVAIASLSMKLGFVIPIVLGVFIYKEEVSIQRMMGIALSVLAIFFASFPSNKDHRIHSKINIFLPVIIFLMSGLCDASIQFLEKMFFKAHGSAFFIGLTFASASLTGGAIIIWHCLFSKAKRRIGKKDIIWGILLGIPNYGSIFFLIKALNNPNWESTYVFSLNNIAIVLLSSVVAYIIFKERLKLLNYIGLALAVISILVISISL